MQTNAQAGLASAEGSLTGTIVSSGSDGDVAHADSNGIGANVPRPLDDRSISFAHLSSISH